MALEGYDSAFESVALELDKVQKSLPDTFEETNTPNDYIAYINAYIGRAAVKVFRNEREDQSFRENMVKAAGLALSAIRAYDKGYFKNVR